MVSTEKVTEGAALKPVNQDGDTRQNILRLLLASGPISATEISSELGLTAAGVRRHLDNLQKDGLAEVIENRTRNRGRGRPAKDFRLTDAGRAEFGHEYDSLAAAALHALRRAGGDAAVAAFAKQRIVDILKDVQPAEDDSESLARTAKEVADALSQHGYAASVTDSGRGVQICQHHCPISHVAEDFPELCAAEHEVVSNLMGQHIQSLATIADGNGICTTYIPITPVTHEPEGRSGS
ncbi:helix-turn-helix transcriptional regulator [Corynebacterium ulceribovis]|uniref:helix-turn-helix transcriptional regulator n=1 Tax=Corynebacterium ulceribovis TaxID=487732 RepID=UPI00036BF302|nr:metalloregulator ArsR/SmtB family transcription factor [Corynebacterium ulceribovis]